MSTAPARSRRRCGLSDPLWIARTRSLIIDALPSLVATWSVDHIVRCTDEKGIRLIRSAHFEPGRHSGHVVRSPLDRCGRWLTGGTRPSRRRPPTGIMAGEPPGAVMERGLFGRETELARVSKLLDRIPSGPVALILGGEAGIGKSTLWLESLSQARARSYRVLSCRPDESEAKLSYAALGDLLEGVVEESLEGLPSPQRSALEVALLRADATAFHGALLALASSSPSVVAIDDAPWLDAPSARVLEFALRRLNDAPIGLVMTARSQELDSLPLGLRRALTQDRIEGVMVGPMTLQATRDMLSSELSARFPRPLLLRIYEASAGNPFLALELGRALLRRGIERELGGTLPVPSTLADLVTDRLSELSDPVGQVLLVTSAASQPTVSLVAQAIGGPTAEDDIEDAFRAGVIEGSAGRIRSTPPLLA